MSIGRRHRAALITLVVLVAGGVSAAWACSAPPPELEVIGTMAKAPGSQATVQGRAYPPQTQIELRWASTGGPVLTTASGPSFNAQVTIPSAARPGLYSVMAVWKADDGVSSHNAATVEVTGPSQPSANSGTRSPSSNEAGTEGATSDPSQPSSPGESGPDSPATSPTGSSAAAAGTKGQIRRAGSNPGAGQASHLAASRSGPAPVVVPAPPALPSPAQTPQPGGSPPPGANPAMATPRAAVGMDDLWSGFLSGGYIGPGLVGPGRTAAPAGNGRAVGFGLIGAAGLAIAWALVGAGLGRRRVRVMGGPGRDG